MEGGGRGAAGGGGAAVEEGVGVWEDGSKWGASKRGSKRKTSFHRAVEEVMDGRGGRIGRGVARGGVHGVAARRVAWSKRPNVWKRRRLASGGRMGNHEVRKSGGVTSSASSHSREAAHGESGPEREG